MALLAYDVPILDANGDRIWAVWWPDTPDTKEWDESQHPRADDGKWTEGGGGTALVAEAVARYGVTEDPDEIGYILPDGKGLRVFTGGPTLPTGSSVGVSYNDHASVAAALTGGQESEATTAEFLRDAGVVRWRPGAGAQMVGRPTPAQIRQIAVLARQGGRREIAVDYTDAAQRHRTSADLRNITVGRLTQWLDATEATWAQSKAWEVKAPTPDALAVLAERLAPTLRRAFLEAIDATHSAIDLEALAQALQTGDVTLAEATLRFDILARALEAAWVPTLRQGFLLGAQAAVGAMKPVLNVGFSLISPTATRWARMHGAALVTQITEDTRAVLKDIVTRGFTEGIAVRDLAKEIRPLIGLTAPHARAVENYRARLLADGVEIGSKVDRYAARLLKLRANTIARNEVLVASGEGQAQQWQAAVAEGLLDGGTVRKRWIVADDERLCDLCAPLDGVEVGLNDVFPGGYLHPPDPHIQCRCTVGLVFPSAKKRWSIKWDEALHPREPAGSESGGEFTEAGGGSASGARAAFWDAAAHRDLPTTSEGVKAIRDFEHTYRTADKESLLLVTPNGDSRLVHGTSDKVKTGPEDDAWMDSRPMGQRQFIATHNHPSTPIPWAGPGGASLSVAEPDIPPSANDLDFSRFHGVTELRVVNNEATYRIRLKPLRGGTFSGSFPDEMHDHLVMWKEDYFKRVQSGELSAKEGVFQLLNSFWEGQQRAGHIESYERIPFHGVLASRTGPRANALAGAGLPSLNKSGGPGGLDDRDLYDLYRQFVEAEHAARMKKGWTVKWDESQHPREPSGSSEGGQFTSGGGGATAAGNPLLPDVDWHDPIALRPRTPHANPTEYRMEPWGKERAGSRLQYREANGNWRDNPDQPDDWKIGDDGHQIVMREDGQFHPQPLKYEEHPDAPQGAWGEVLYQDWAFGAWKVNPAQLGALRMQDGTIYELKLGTHDLPQWVPSEDQPGATRTGDDGHREQLVGMGEGRAPEWEQMTFTTPTPTPTPTPSESSESSYVHSEDDRNLLPAADPTPHPSAGSDDDDATQLAMHRAGITWVHHLGGGVSQSYKVTMTDGTQAVWKPSQDTGFNRSANREYINDAAAYDLAKLVGYEDIVAPTIVRTINGKKGSLQRWMGGTSPLNGNYSRRDRERAVAFDYVIGNFDRHEGNWYNDNDKPVLIDNGRTFPKPQFRPNLYTTFGAGDHEVSREAFVEWKKVLDNRPNVERILRRNGMDAETVGAAFKRIERIMLVNAVRDTWDKVVF